MEARVKFRQETLKQEGTVGKILRWLQDNPRYLRDTSANSLAKSMSLARLGSEQNIRVTLYKMINNQMLTRVGTKRRSDFIINYYHKDLPGYILDRAPQEMKDRVRRMKENLKSDQRMTKEGVLVTKGTKEDVVEETLSPENSKTEEANLPKEEVSSDASEENTTSVPVTITDTERGLSISITLNLNINK